jgi:hypothetical protein
MNRKIIVGAALGLAMAGVTAAIALAQGQPMPWGQPSDQLAWETFVQVVAPSGNPGATAVEFETWASDQDIYVAPGSTPHWPTANAPKLLRASPLGQTHLSHNLKILSVPQGSCSPPQGTAAATAAGFPANGCIGEEVRRNWASFQYIVSNGLWSVDGLKKAYAQKLVVDLPADAIEFKGDWVKVTDLMAWLHLTSAQVHQQYYVNSASSGGAPTEFALVAFHFSTKQQKDWVWGDFEHQMNPGRCDTIGCNDSFGAAQAAVKPNAKAWQPYGACKKSPALAAMMTNAGIAAVWQNYCLKGSQVTFGTAAKPSLLGNSVIEAINADVPISSSSCISCHRVASFAADGSPNGHVSDNLVGPVPASVMNGFLTNDFIWGSLFAQ